MPYTNNADETSSILIIDDDATMRLLMRETLSDDTYIIDEAENGSAGLEQIKIRKPDLILLDVNMPGISGFDVCSEIRRIYGDSDISIVMVTALDDPKSIEKAYEIGATDFINKPINWDTLPYRIQYLIKARKAIVEINSYKLHLEHMEHATRIITQNKHKDIIMQEAMSAMLDIFSADRSALIKPDETGDNRFIIDYEVTNSDSIDGITVPLTDILNDGVFNRADISEYPIVLNYDNTATNADVGSSALPKRQMLSALQLKDTQNWYLLIHQNTAEKNWSIADVETFYKISLRLTNMLSRHLLTDKLRQSKNLLKQAQKIGHLGNWYWNAKSNQLIWSDEVYTIYQRHEDSYTPDINDYFQIEFEEDDERLDLFKKIKNITANGSYQIDHRIRRSDNTVRWVHEECIGVYDYAGNLVEVNGIVQDVTDAHNKKEQEVHENKMEAIGQLTSGIAHDFGNLMTVAKGNIELLGDSLARQEGIKADDLELLEDAQSAVVDSVKLTRQLLSFSRKKSIAPVYININSSIKRIKKLVKYTLGDNMNVSLDIVEDLPDILVDPTQFESSILNIIINARDAMPDGGDIHIRAEILTLDDSYKGVQNKDNDLDVNCVCIYIKDSGVGMSDEIIEHAIEPFYTSGKQQGTGLGLSMVYGFMKQSGGELIIHSLPGKGSTIYMQFPIYDGVAEESSVTDSEKSLNGIEATILVVEDQHKVRQYAVRCLDKPGITILQAEDAASAQEHIKSNHIDLLFTDILMPGSMNGKELADWTSRNYPEIKILLTTAMDKAILKNEDGSEQDDDAYRFKILAKPYSKTELSENIYNIFNTGSFNAGSTSDL